MEQTENSMRTRSINEAPLIYDGASSKHTETIHNTLRCRHSVHDVALLRGVSLQLQPFLNHERSKTIQNKIKKFIWIKLTFDKRKVFLHMS